MTQQVKNMSSMQEMQVQSLGQKDLLEKEKAIHSSIVAWRISWTEKTGGLQSRGSQRVRYDWVTKHILYTHTHTRVVYIRGSYIKFLSSTYDNCILLLRQRLLNSSVFGFFFPFRVWRNRLLHPLGGNYTWVTWEHSTSRWKHFRADVWFLTPLFPHSGNPWKLALDS